MLTIEEAAQALAAGTTTARALLEESFAAVARQPAAFMVLHHEAARAAADAPLEAVVFVEEDGLDDELVGGARREPREAVREGEGPAHDRVVAKWNHDDRVGARIGTATTELRREQAQRVDGGRA